MLNSHGSSWLSLLYFYADIVFYTLVLAALDFTRFLRANVFTQSDGSSLNSVNVVIHSTPTFFAAFWRHMLHRSNRSGTPYQELSYTEGLELVREFLQFAATHTVEELQRFTGKETPAANWVEKSIVEIPTECLERSAETLRIHLERDDPGFKDVGGAQWWTLRARPLYGEWLEMLRDVQKHREMREAGEEPPERIMLYLHGGAHYFAGNGTHRYQIQRHARKLGAKAFSVSFRLSPQYPFPCSLQDALAAYLYLISPPPGGPLAVHAHNIVLYGDSSGGALALSLLIVLRDAGLPTPAGCVLLSSWVDLTHSFPSVLTNAAGDYIPAHGFHYRPSLSWPPIRGDPMVFKSQESKDGKKPAELVVKEQIQLYCSNSMISHPMVSLVNQGSLGGLPPLCIIGGSAELLADEIMYIAHKAADPASYPPAEATLARYPHQAFILSSGKYSPTQVQLQMFDDCCHVATTLSFSTPAKYMYRSAANFGLWALQNAQSKVKADMHKDDEQAEHRETHRDYATASGEGKEVEAPPQDASPPRARLTTPVGADLSPSASRDKARSRTSSMASGHLPWTGDTSHGDYAADEQGESPSLRARTTSSSRRFSQHAREASSPLKNSFFLPQVQNPEMGDSGYTTQGNSREASPEEQSSSLPLVASPPADEDVAGQTAGKQPSDHIHIADQPIEELRAKSAAWSPATLGADEPSPHQEDGWDEGSDIDSESDRDSGALRDPSPAREKERQEARRMSLVNLASFRREKEYSWLEDREKLSAPSSQEGSSRPASAMSQTVPSPDVEQEADPISEKAHTRADAHSAGAPSEPSTQTGGPDRCFVTVSGSLPAFKNSMIRERVSADGIIRPMEPAAEIAALNMPRERVGNVSPEGPVVRWLEKRRAWDARYRRELVRFRKLKMQDWRKASKAGYLSRELEGENPPLSAVAGFYSEALAWEAVKGQDSTTNADGQREHAGLGVMLWSKLSMKPDAQQEGKKALDELAKKGNEKLKRLPSDSAESIDTPAVERELQI